MPDYNRDHIKKLWKLPFEGAWPSAVVYTGPHQIAVGNQDGAILVWDIPEQPVEITLKDDKGNDIPGLEMPTSVRRLDGHTNGVTKLAAIPERNLLISVSLDRTIRLWDLTVQPTGTEVMILDARTRDEKSRWADDARKQAIREVPGFTVSIQNESIVLGEHPDWIQALALSRDGQRLLTGDDSGLVKIWDLETRKELNHWQCPGVAWVAALAISPDGQTALVSQYHRKGGDWNNYPAGLRLYDIAKGQVQLDIFATMYPDEKNPPYAYQYAYSEFIAEGLYTAAFSNDGKLLIVGQGGEGGPGKAHVLDAETGKLVRDVSGHQYGICDFAQPLEGQLLFTAGRDTQVRIVRLDNGEEVAKFGEPRGGQFTDWIASISLSPDERRLAAADISGHVQVWQLAE